ncbi:LysM peptidoglycan-binding domain-containing protein [Arthrobacter sp. NPDC092385]|uniref:LysM peptidoglycan-binding domain-containing protein n=1 Tax=Arthrobacter sp. NPDC092385 TaxID=3363943 RepID=UPI0037F11F88
MAEALHGSTALWALTPARSGATLRSVPALPQATAPSGDGQRSTQRPLTLTRRGRLLLVGLPIALGVAALILLGAFLTSQAQAGESAPTTSQTLEVSIAAGESLWDLAVRYAPERDPRDVVAEMVELNNLGTSIVQAGQRISVPAEG